MKQKPKLSAGNYYEKGTSLSVELIYKTTNREALHWWRKLEAEKAVVMDRREAYEAKALELYGPMGSRYNSRTMHSEHENERRLIVQGRRAVGLSCRIDEVPPEGSGWRLDSKEKWWFPKLAVAAGKKRRDELSDLHLPNIARRGHTAFGIPEVFFGGSHMYRPGYVYRADTNELYVVWSGFECRKAMESAIRPEIWKMVSREEWYAWREQIEKSD